MNERPGRHFDSGWQKYEGYFFEVKKIVNLY